MDDLAPGSLLADRYRLTKVLGEGGMGAVYEAVQINLNREVAIKVMHAAVGLAEDSKLRFEREARVSAALHHPNAVKIFDFGEDASGRLYLVMEKLRGTTLRTFVHPDLPPMSLARAVDIGLQVAQVLVAAHELGLVHRDLKPENIFLEEAPSGGDRVVVVDFGLAFIEQREDANRMTQEGMVMGTPFYMSPEQCHGVGVGGPTDVYALGCMLYEMATSYVPFDGATIVLLSRHVFEPPVPPSKRRNDVYIPRALEDLILRMMAKKPEQRPLPADIAAALGQLQHTLGERERGRGRELLEGREARMIHTVRHPDERRMPEPARIGAAATLPPSERPPILDPSAVNIAVVAPALEDGFVLAMRANGYAPLLVSGPPMPEGMAAIYAPDASIAVLTDLLQYGPPVITDVDPSTDMKVVSSLLTLGVAEVLNRPVRPEKLAHKLERAIKKQRRK